MKETNNTDNKLRQLENQSLPDLSRQDEHWQEIKKMLPPGLTAIKPAATGKIWKWIVAACIIGGVAFTGYKFLNTNKKETKKESTASVVIKPAIEVLDTMKGKTAIADLFPDNPAYYPVRVVVTKIPFIRYVFENTDTSANPLIALPDTTISNTDKPKATLAEFFAQLEKPSQEFSIDNSRDTVINGNDGTALLIPANTFNTKGKVTIVLKEYYSYEDIITNKLCTTSDGKQLVSGGMIHLYAVANGKPVDISPDRSIQWLVPDTSESVTNMQLFDGEFNRLAAADTATESLENLNWAPSTRFFKRQWSTTYYKVLDLPNSPYKERITRKGTIGKFKLSKKAKLSPEETIAQMKKKYGYYKVKVLKQRKYGAFRKLFHGFFDGAYWTGDNMYTDIGDSSWVLPFYAKMFRLPISDTITNVQNGFVYEQGTYVKKTFKNVNLNELSKRFSVDIRQLGWINCDKFYYDQREKLNYYVNLIDSAENYYTILVYDRIKSMVRGTVSGNKVLFTGVPKGEPARIISIGIHDGKAVAAMEPLNPSKTELTDLKFEETTPAAFKEQAATMDK